MILRHTGIILLLPRPQPFLPIVEITLIIRLARIATQVIVNKLLKARESRIS